MTPNVSPGTNHRTMQTILSGPAKLATLLVACILMSFGLIFLVGNFVAPDVLRSQPVALLGKIAFLIQFGLALFAGVVGIAWVFQRPWNARSLRLLPEYVASASRTHWIKSYLREMKARIQVWFVLGTLVLLILGAVMVLVSFQLAPLDQGRENDVSFFLRWIGIALVATAMTSGLVQIFFIRYNDLFRTEIERFLEDDVKQALDRVYQAHSSVEAITNLGITQMYQNRAKSSEDLATHLLDPQTEEIRVLGITLGDFMQGRQESLGKAWAVLSSYIETGIPENTERQDDLKIRVLIIDPLSLGARLRSEAELQEPVRGGSLISDAEAAIEKLYQLQVAAEMRNRIALAPSEVSDDSPAKALKVTFEFRLYRVPPLLFLCQVEKPAPLAGVSFVQPYYLKAKRDVNEPLPLFSCRPTSDTGRPDLHADMKQHFEMLWETSIKSADYVEGKEVGIDKGAYSSGLVNVLTTDSEIEERVLRLLQGANRRVWIMGISVRSFFEEGERLSAIVDLINRPDNRRVEIRFLLLKSSAIQAYYRSFRELVLRYPQDKVTFADYHTDKSQYKHVDSHIYHEIVTSKHVVKRLADRVRENVLRNGANTSEDLASRMMKIMWAREYSCDPACFMMLVDETLLFRPYHYGKLVADEIEGVAIPNMEGIFPMFEYYHTPYLMKPSDSSTALSKRFSVEQSELEEENKSRRPGAVTTAFRSGEWVRLPTHPLVALFQRDLSNFHVGDMRNTFELLENHFSFVYDRCSEEFLTIPGSSGPAATENGAVGTSGTHGRDILMSVPDLDKPTDSMNHSGSNAAGGV